MEPEDDSQSNSGAFSESLLALEIFFSLRFIQFCFELSIFRRKILVTKCCKSGVANGTPYILSSVKT